MNTASRMESNGKPGSIQVSDTTAALLRAAGKSHWLKEREDRSHRRQGQGGDDDVLGQHDDHGHLDSPNDNVRFYL